MLNLSLLVILALGFGIGASLGLLGGGGSILTVPALVYIVGQSPQAAIATSLAIVGANSGLGAWFHLQQGTLKWKVALLFGAAGMVAAYPAATVSRHLPGGVLLVAFAGLMLVIGAVMLLRRDQETAGHSPRSWLGNIGGGLAVGALTGVLGVGGGFLIVPALILLVGLPMKEAVGTSLAVIALNSAAALAGHWGDTLNWSLMLTFIAAGLAGTFSGARLAQYLPASRLRQLFAVFVIVLGMYLLFDNLPKLLG